METTRKPDDTGGRKRHEEHEDAFASFVPFSPSPPRPNPQELRRMRIAIIQATWTKIQKQINRGKQP